MKAFLKRCKNYSGFALKVGIFIKSNAWAIAIIISSVSATFSVLNYRNQKLHNVPSVMEDSATFKTSNSKTAIFMSFKNFGSRTAYNTNTYLLKYDDQLHGFLLLGGINYAVPMPKDSSMSHEIAVNINNLTGNLIVCAYFEDD